MHELNALSSAEQCVAMITRARSRAGHDPAPMLDEACFARHRERSRPTTSPQAQPVSRSHPISVSQVRSRVTQPVRR
jgi:hypothetical protein